MINLKFICERVIDFFNRYRKSEMLNSKVNRRIMFHEVSHKDTEYLYSDTFKEPAGNATINKNDKTIQQ